MEVSKSQKSLYYWEATNKEKAISLLDGEHPLFAKYSDNILFDEIRFIEFCLTWYKSEFIENFGCVREDSNPKDRLRMIAYFILLQNLKFSEKNSWNNPNEYTKAFLDIFNTVKRTVGFGAGLRKQDFLQFEEELKQWIRQNMK